MFGGGGGLDPSKLQQMMDQMGIDVDDIDAEEVVIRTAEEELVFDGPDVQRMEAQGQETYQVIGEPTTRPRGEGSAVSEGAAGTADSGAESGTAETGTETDTGSGSGSGSGDSGDIPDSDVQIVAGRTGASREDAREALREADGDLAAAVERLE